MTVVDAALAATYPVIVILGTLIWVRFLPVLGKIENGTRTIVCANLIIVLTVIWEQALYGYGRFFGDYVRIATNPLLVGTAKVLYMIGFGYMLYAFWLIAPARARLSVTFSMVALTWGAVFVALLA